MKISGKDVSDKIELHEEPFLMLIERHNLDCPILNAIWESFYEGPLIYPQQAGKIVVELGIINEFIVESNPDEINQRDWDKFYQRLGDFFTLAKKSGSIVRCMSD